MIPAHIQPERIKILNDQAPAPGDYVLYWMQASQRTSCNHAFDYAVCLANRLHLPVVVGFGLAKTEYALGRLMAFDADVLGTWGCLPEYYPAVLDMVLKGKVNIEEFVQTRPMSTIVETFDEAHSTSPDKRIVLTPDF